ncbi:S9 family peptidase [Caulobacter segnis]|uniref:Peptidase S9 prolyl oligopeptidase active site domain protein n=2 Tax=Caulobacter segnis TaxID=88688 RepID=D5VME2_CAUST|nr:S9 family peptidase [Caulobacter segnis]ADG11665.1 peptidase S9 prolyl oligopeptidase active site domain protein [Caulobacter segnis ATCC 21756]AVQ03311.1 S9 family peptidase [Caulobacter segnis]
MIKSFLAAGAACFALCSSAAFGAEKPDLAIYGRLPQFEGVTISPDGSKLALILTDGEERLLAIRTLNGQTLAGVKAAKTKLRGVLWAGEDHVVMLSTQTANVFGLSGPAREYMMAVDFNLVTRKQSLLLRSQPESMNVILDRPMVRTVDGQPVVFVEGIHFFDNTGVNTLFRINLKDGATRMLDGGVRMDTDGWLVDAAGEPVAQSLYDGKKGRWSLRMKIGSSWKTVDEADSPMGSYGLSGFGRDGKSVLVWRTDDENNSILREYRGVGAHEDLPGDLDLSGLLHDPDSLGLLGGYTLKGDDLAYTFFDPVSQRAWDSVTKAFKGDRVSLASWSKNRRRVVVHVDSAVDGPAYALIDLDTKRASWLGEIYRGLSAEAVSPVRPVKYKAADGLEITGYLTLPKGRDPKNLPLIVLPHGGPEGRDSPGFDWWSQALASRGYAVLQPNFRGSEGFGWDFVKAGFGEWGRKMQTDLSDGVRDLAKQGIVDPKRVCVVGASYGGYAALAGATLDRGVYRCAVSVAGPSDLKKMLLSVRDAHNGSMSAAQRYWLRFMGADGIKDPDLAAISPARLADKVEIPILLIHGKDDTVVRYDQSQIMADALKKAGKPVAFVTLDGEDHWLSRGATRLKMLSETVAFVEKHNPPE